MLIDFVIAMFGLSLLAIGGEALVRGALGAGQRLGLSPAIAGLVIVGFGTSAPELVVSVDAALKQLPGVALGNVIGSNIGNILLILGACALIAPLSVTPRLLMRDGTVMLGAMVVFSVLALGSGLSRFDAGLLLALLVAYLIWACFDEVRAGSGTASMHEAETKILPPVQGSWLALSGALVGGLALLIVGSRLTLSGVIGLGQALGVPSTVMGLTLVAVGTSLPEFAVSVVAVLKKQHDVAIGNVLGSNLFNTLGILGISGLLQPLVMDGRLARIDVWVMLGSGALLLILLASGLRLTRIKGAVLLIAYCGYIATMFWSPGV